LGKCARLLEWEHAGVRKRGHSTFSPVQIWRATKAGSEKVECPLFLGLGQSEGMAQGKKLAASRFQEFPSSSIKQPGGNEAQGD
jgi:hypothetical protein